MGIQINANTNNINAGIGSLSIEDINELDIVGVATAANFKTGVSNLHNVGLTLSGGQIDVGSNIKIGTAGVLTATSFVGSGANLTSLPAQATIANNADNRVITGGSGVNLNGEANLTFDGSTLGIVGAATLGNGSGLNWGDTSARIRGESGASGLLRFDTNGGERLRISSNGKVTIGDSSGFTPVGLLHLYQATNDPYIYIQKGNAGDSAVDLGGIYFRNSTNSLASIYSRSDNINSGNIIFQTMNAGTLAERLRIDSSGRLLIGTTTEGHPAGDNLTVADSGHAGITIRSGTTSNGALYFSDGTSGSDEYRGGVVYHHDGNYMRFYTNGTERIRIDSSGTFHVKTNGMNLENATATNSRGYSITNAAGTTGWTFGNGITASSHQYVIYDNTAGSARFQINGNGAFGLNGGNYGAAREVMVSNGSGSAVSWSANPFVIDMASLGDLDPGKLFVRYREVNVTGNGLVYLEICKSTTNCGPGRSGYPIGFVPGVVYNSQFRVDKVGITPWPNGSGHRYEFFAIISDFVASGKLGIYYLTNTTS